MTYNLSHVTSNPIVLSSAVLASIGWLVTFIGACSAQIHGASWWIIVYELFLLIAIYVVLAKQLFRHYQLVLLTMLAISIAMLTLLIEMFLSRGGGGSKAAAAGACVLVIMQYMWVFIFGSTEQSSVHGTVYGLQTPMASHAHFGNDMHHYQQQQQNRHHHYSSTSAITASAVSVPVSPQSPKLQEKQETAPLQHTKTMSAPVQHATTPKAVVAKDEVKALHTYRANPNDPNELSFEKDELIEILDRRGNWWQAKKHNGAIGIVPSNYFTP